MSTATDNPAAAAEPRLAAILGEFEDPAALLKAAETVHGEGYRQFDTYSPFPIHGMDQATGEKPSILGWICFLAGAGGCLAGLGLQWWTSAVNYPIVTSGKEYFSLPAFIPVTFEITILCAALAAVLGMFVLNGLPRLHHPLFNSARLARATDNGFFLAIEARDPKFDPEQTRRFLESVGARKVELVPDED